MVSYQQRQNSGAEGLRTLIHTFWQLGRAVAEAEAEAGEMIDEINMMCKLLLQKCM